MSRRQRIISELQEQNVEIIKSIQNLQVDLRLNQSIIDELSGSSGDEDVPEISIELIPRQISQGRNTYKNKKSNNTERKEGFEKARAWHLERIKQKQLKKTK